MEELKTYLLKKELLESDESEKNDFVKTNTHRRLSLYQRRCKRLAVVCVMLIFMIVGMLIVAATSNSPNILNYREKIIDNYAGWEQELTERERELDEREEALEKMEQKQK